MMYLVTSWLISFATEVHMENLTCLCCRQCHCSSIAAAIIPKQVLENGVLMGFWLEMSSGSVWNLVPSKFVEYLEAILGLTVQLAAKWCYCEVWVESSKLMETSVFFSPTGMKSLRAIFLTDNWKANCNVSDSQRSEPSTDCFAFLWSNCSTSNQKQYHTYTVNALACTRSTCK